MSPQALLQELKPRCPAWNAAGYMDDSPPPNASDPKPAAACPDWLVKLVQIRPPVRLTHP